VAGQSILYPIAAVDTILEVALNGLEKSSQEHNVCIAKTYVVEANKENTSHDTVAKLFMF
jgi:hypothetical protein